MYLTCPVPGKPPAGAPNRAAPAARRGAFFGADFAAEPPECLFPSGDAPLSLTWEKPGPKWPLFAHCSHPDG
jgi:hypothetical protein